MRNVTAPSPTGPAVQDGTGEADKRCAACRHRWAAHDGTSARYCAATIVSGTARGRGCASDGTTAGTPAAR